MMRQRVGLAWRRRAALLAALLLWLAPVALATEPGGSMPLQKAGLMWNRTGLPAVFPLQVKSPAGTDYFLTLTNSETGAEALAAYIEGGMFFKVLVPPGRYVLRFASGTGWQGEAALFGAGTQRLELPQPLEFAIRGPGLKAGHAVTLSRHPQDGLWRAEVKGQYICQVASLEAPEPVLLQRKPPALRFRLRGSLHSRWQLHLDARQSLSRHGPGLRGQKRAHRRFALGKLPGHRHDRFRPRAILPLAEPVFRSYAVRSLFCG